MLCEEIKEIIPGYISHNLPEAQITEIEEHLCVCNDCRRFLGQLMDKPNSALEKIKPQAQEEIAQESTAKRLLPFEYIILAVGAIVLIFFIYLLFKS
jgi:predicted anti-sigma-YlaC factor YlaD